MITAALYLFEKQINSKREGEKSDLFEVIGILLSKSKKEVKSLRVGMVGRQVWLRKTRFGCSKSESTNSKISVSLVKFQIY